MKPAQWQKKKSWQWRIIVCTSLFLIFGKSVSSKISEGFSLAWSSATAAITRASVVPQVTAMQKKTPILAKQFILEVNNDTSRDYTITSKIIVGQLNYESNSLMVGEVKKFIVSANDDGESAYGDLIFTSTPIDQNNSTCQAIHVLNYNLKDAINPSQPLKINLSSIASRLECTDNIDQ